MRQFLLAFFIALLAVTPVSAISERTLDFFAKNGIYYYNPDGFADGCYAGLGSYDGITSAGLSSLQSAFVDTYHEIAIQLSSEYGIPWEAVMAQGILESASGTTKYARERNNFFGLNAVDSNPDLAYSYPSPQAGWRGYYEFIKSNPRYTLAGAFNYPNDPYGYIVAIKSAGYATDPDYVPKVSRLIKAIHNRATEKNWSSSSTQESGYFHDCNSSTQGNGDLNSTALELSWPDRTHPLNDPKPIYTTALNATGLSNSGDEYVKIGASCDVFVATVLRYSGADPNVPCCGVDTLYKYFSSHPELYEEIPNLGNTSNMQPGDIRIKTAAETGARHGHVEMYVVDETGAGKIASASWNDRTADHGINYYPDSAYRIFRLKGTA